MLAFLQSSTGLDNSSKLASFQKLSKSLSSKFLGAFYTMLLEF